MYNFMKQKYIEVESAVEYRNYQKKLPYKVFLTKRRLKDTKMKKLI